MNPNTEYERFTQEIIQQLCQATSIKVVTIKHDVKLVGRSGQKHQIDVYWEYEKSGKTYRVAIECKNYSRRISLEKVCAFKGVLDDLDGVKGIMVSKEGFQKGVKKYAREYGISLKELRSPRSGETIIGTIENHLHLEVRYSLFRIDAAWASENGFDLDRYRERLSLLFISRDELWNRPPYIYLERKDDVLRDASGREVANLINLEKQIPNHPTNDSPFIFKFDDAYLDSRYFGPVKILEVLFDYNVKDEVKTIALDAGNLVKTILKDTQSDQTDFVSLI